MGLEVLRIQKMESSKHVFSHKEWHMKAFQIRVDELADKEEKPEKEQWIFVETKEAEEKYPLPSAFAAYTKYLNIMQGSDKMKLSVEPLVISEEVKKNRMQKNNKKEDSINQD